MADHCLQSSFMRGREEKLSNYYLNKLSIFKQYVYFHKLFVKWSKTNLILLFDINVFILIAFLCKIYETIRLGNHVQFAFKYILYWTRLCLLLRFFLWVWGLNQILCSCYEETGSMTKMKLKEQICIKCVYICVNYK